MVYVHTCPSCNPLVSRGTLCASCAAREAAADAEDRAHLARLLAMDRDEYDAWLLEQTEAFMADSDARLDCERRHGR